MWENKITVEPKAEQTHLKVKTRFLSEHLSKHTVCCLMWIWQSSMSSRSLAQLSPLVVAPATDIMLESTTLDGVCLAQAKKALAVCFNYPHAGSPHWAPYVKAGPHPSPCQTGVSIIWLNFLHLRKKKSADEPWTMPFQFMLMPLALIGKPFVMQVYYIMHFLSIPQVTCCLLWTI